MKTILVLAMFLATNYAKTYKMAISTSGTLRARVLAAKLARNITEEHPRPSDLVLTKRHLQPFRDYYDDFYLGNVTIGTPGQSMSLLLDTGSANLWVVFDVACRSFACRGLPDSAYTRRRFNTRKSSTYFRKGRAIHLRYGAGWCSGPLAQDVVSFAGLEIKQQQFIPVTQISDSFAYVAIDGILGLGWPAASVGVVTPPLQNILSSLDDPLFTIWVDKKSVDKPIGKTGQITFGAVDTTNCKPEINYVPLSSEKHWQFTIEGVSIGNYSEKKSEQVISDTGASWIGAPAVALNAVVKQTGAEYDSLNKFHTVNCSTMNTLPDLVFTINGIKYNVSSDKYVLDIGIGDGQCALAFFELHPGGLETDWILGDAWIRTYCNIYDIGNRRIGFAKAIHSKV